MITSSLFERQQIPLIHEVYIEDQYLLNTIEGEWYPILYHFEWENYRQIGAEYYNALYDFNTKQTQKNDQINRDSLIETKDEAKQRLLFDRTTMKETEGKKAPIIYQGKVVEVAIPKVSPQSISPGIVPIRGAGKKPKCFFSLFKSFMGTTLMGFPPEPEKVHLLLKSNPSFVRICGFSPKYENSEYYYKHIPSLRKLEQFDQIMTQYGLWDKIKKKEVQANIESKVIKRENVLVGDTTHYHAYSGFETIHYEDINKNEKKKSQSKLTKNCRCPEKTTCSHEWILADDGAGTIVKGNNKMFWGHKASVIGLPNQGIPLDAVAIRDAATNDGKTLLPHIIKLFKDYPLIQDWTEIILYDSACDIKELKAAFSKEFGIDLKTSLNPRGKKEITKELPRGIEKITPYGIPICGAGYCMDYKGVRFKDEKFIYQAPKTSDGTSVCLSCWNRKSCCSTSNTTGRTVTISFETLPHIDSSDPPMAKRYKAIMSRRPSVERMIKRLKCDLSDDRLTKRGNDSFQAYLDKTMIAFHLLLRN